MDKCPTPTLKGTGKVQNPCLTTTKAQGTNIKLQSSKQLEGAYNFYLSQFVKQRKILPRNSGIIYMLLQGVSREGGGHCVGIDSDHNNRTAYVLLKKV